MEAKSLEFRCTDFVTMFNDNMLVSIRFACSNDGKMLLGSIENQMPELGDMPTFLLAKSNSAIERAYTLLINLRMLGNTSI